jgi:hypothetical protein
VTASGIDVIDVALRVAAALEAAGGEYFVGGSFASSLQGEPRATNDVDFVIDLGIGRVEPFVARLGPDFEIDVDQLRDAIRRGTCANGFYLPWVLKVDFFGHAHGPFDESEFSRRTLVTVRDDGSALWVKTPEDTVLRKLWWFVQGGAVSDRQWRDVQGVLRAHRATLDPAYLDRWAQTLGVSELLEKARREAAD